MSVPENQPTERAGREELNHNHHDRSIKIDKRKKKMWMENELQVALNVTSLSIKMIIKFIALPNNEQ